MAVIEVQNTNIVTLNVDVIVNAANETLLGGGGVDGAIHRAAGPMIMRECYRLDGCKSGDAKITGGGDLPVKYIIHAVGPRYTDGDHGEAKLLASAYRNSLILAANNGCESIAFPAISCGVFRFPVEQASGIAIGTIMEETEKLPIIKRVVFVCADDTYQIFQDVLSRLDPNVR